MDNSIARIGPMLRIGATMIACLLLASCASSDSATTTEAESQEGSTPIAASTSSSTPEATGVESSDPTGQLALSPSPANEAGTSGTDTMAEDDSFIDPAELEGLPVVTEYIRQSYAGYTLVRVLATTNGVDSSPGEVDFWEEDMLEMCEIVSAAVRDGNYSQSMGETINVVIIESSGGQDTLATNLQSDSSVGECRLPWE